MYFESDDRRTRSSSPMIMMTVKDGRKLVVIKGHTSVQNCDNAKFSAAHGEQFAYRRKNEEICVSLSELVTIRASSSVPYLR